MFEIEVKYKHHTTLGIGLCDVYISTLNLQGCISVWHWGSSCCRDS